MSEVDYSSYVEKSLNASSPAGEHVAVSNGTEGGGVDDDNDTPLKQNENSNDKKKSATTEETSMMTAEERLSHDLTTFLSNPSLQQSLSDGSLDLVSYSQVVETELAKLESDCIDIYHQKAYEIANLRDEMDACDNVLASLQEMLLGFRADLGGLSGDIRLLQEQSHTLEVQLRNRKGAEAGLRQFLERIVVPPNLADVICNREVDQLFVDCVKELCDKYYYVHGVRTGRKMIDDVHGDGLSSKGKGRGGGVSSVSSPLKRRSRRRKADGTKKRKEKGRSRSGEHKRRIDSPYDEDGSRFNEDDDKVEDNRRGHQDDDDDHDSFSSDGEASSSSSRSSRSSSSYTESTYSSDSTSSCSVPEIVPEQTNAGREMKAHIDRLRLMAVQRTRDYFLSKIGELRRPKTNVRMIQVNALLRYSQLNEFLYEASPDVYNEVKDVYVDSMGKTLVALFRTYQAQLSRLDSKIANRHDLIAVEEASLRDVFSNRVNLDKRGDTFFLGDRAQVLDLVQNNARPLLAHVALAEGSRYPYEMIFRSVMTHLMDAATNEYVFVHRFFIPSAGGGRMRMGDDASEGVETTVPPAESGVDIFSNIFARTLSLVLEQLENYLFDCYDCLALLLMIKLVHSCRRIMKYTRKITALDGFFEKMARLLWPRLKMVMDAQLRSLRLANASKLGGVELHAHYVSRRYAEFTSSILQILNKGKKQQQQTLQHVAGGGGDGSGTATAAAASSASSSSAAAGATSTTTIHLARASTAPATASSSSSLRRTQPVHRGHSEPYDGSDHHQPHPTPGRLARDYSVGSDLSPASRGDRSITSAGGGHRQGPPPPTSMTPSAGDMLMSDLSLILSETVHLLERLADEHVTSNKNRTVFLINNYDAIICIFQERRVVGREMTKFVDLLMKQRELFVEEELLQYYSKMIAFVQQTESQMAGLTTSSSGRSTARSGGATASAAMVDINEAVVESLVREFASSWRLGIEQINRKVLSYFSNFRNGMEILKQVLTQLLLYYTRFQDIIRKTWRNKQPPSFCKDLVSTTVILAEIKKYALSI